MLRFQLCLHVDSLTRQASFHSSSLLHGFQAFKARQKNVSRSKLTKDLKPGSNSANLEVAPLQKSFKAKSLHDELPKSRGVRSNANGRGYSIAQSQRNAAKETKQASNFERDPLPHAGPDVKPAPVQEGRAGSYRRRSRQRNKIEDRAGRWSTELATLALENPNERGSLIGSASRSRSIISGKLDPTIAAITSHDPGQLPTKFTSPPIMPGILSCLWELIGRRATPTPIQALSLKWLSDDSNQVTTETRWKQFLLASETGSGKSLAYLLPLLQDLKQSELDGRVPPPPPGPKRPLNPRALVLAPTHELSRQLSGFAKSLLHEVKLRVFCASRANVKNTKESDTSARQMLAQAGADNDETGMFEVKQRSGFPVDVVFGTPMKLLELVKGRGWDRRESRADGECAIEPELDLNHKLRRGRDKMIGFGKWRSQPEMSLANVEWVVVDEADVLFDPDFEETTRQLLADISSARGRPLSVSPAFPPSSYTTPPAAPSSLPKTNTRPEPIEYPFNLILTSATIPSSLATYLDTYHPKLKRLASPRLHHLPKTLQTEYVDWTGGNKLADVERRIRRVWSEDASIARAKGYGESALTRILIFCNKSSAVEEMGKYLEEKGIKNVALSSTSEQRKRGSNHHLDGFLRTRGLKDTDEASARKPGKTSSAPPDTSVNANADLDPSVTPHVMITTSLLSRGLDFSPSIKHVFIVNEPRNMIDFLHRAGRTGRAGEKGRVVIFGKMTGRGSASAKEVRRKVGSLLAH